MVRRSRCRRARDVDDAVNVMQRQKRRDAVGRAPFPGQHQALDLRLDVRMRGHDALRFARRTARVENHRATFGRDVGQLFRRSGNDRFHVDQSRTPSRSQIGEILTAIAVSAIKIYATESVRAYSHSEIVADRQMGTTIPPARQMAHCAAEYSTPGDTSSATRVSFKSFSSPSKRRCGRCRRVVEQILVGVYGCRGTECDRLGV